MNDEGLYTKIWGGDMWRSLHYITFNYPYNPTETDKQNYYSFFMMLCNVLPCCSCRNNYAKHIKEPDTELKMEVFTNRKTLTKWLFDMHSKVCFRLGYDYGMTYDDFYKKYDSYVARDNFTDEKKKEAFKNYYNEPAPIVDINILLSYSKYATEMGFNQFEQNISKYLTMDRNSDEWIKRNNICNEIIKQMKLNGIKSLTDNNMPTKEELTLMQYGCSNLNKCELIQIIKKKKTYKLLYVGTALCEQ